MQGGSAERKTCASDCGLLIPFIIVQFCGVFLTFFATMPSVVASLRAVREEERSLALGLQSIILRVVGSIPGPILFGVFMDKACSLWEQTCGNCCLISKDIYSLLLFSCLTIPFLRGARFLSVVRQLPNGCLNGNTSPKYCSTFNT